ncbi:MAG: DUF5655 domain-containing protein [Pseudobdellovibrionaceae bacterium]
MAKKKAQKAKATSKAKLKTKPKAKAKKKYTHHPDHYNTSVNFLINPLEEDFKDAWFKLREFGESLGEQRVYASGKAIMFSKKVCYFFVRPKKSYLEVVIFLKSKKSAKFFKSIRPVSKTKYSHTFRLVHSDQVEGDLIDAIAEAYRDTES